MEDLVGEKRRTDNVNSQSELLKKTKVSQGGNTNTMILAEAGSQPCQKQWVPYVETVGGLGTNE